jgi:hypothetical protein
MIPFLNRVPRCFLAVTAAAATLGLAGAARAALKFDVTSGGSPAAAGYTALNVPTGGNSGSATVGTIAVTLASGTSSSARTDRAPLSGDDLLDDLIFAQDSAALTFTFTGLQAGTSYRFTVYSADKSTPTSNDISAFYLGSSTTPFLSGVKVVNEENGSAAAKYSGTFTAATSDPVIITSKTISGVTPLYTVVNGFELSVVPEPGSLALLGLGALVLLRQRRRR